MMNMNGFTFGFFFPKQDFVQPAKDAAQAAAKDVPQKTLFTSLASGDAGDRPAPLSLYAYRFF